MHFSCVQFLTLNYEYCPSHSKYLLVLSTLKHRRKNLTKTNKIKELGSFVRIINLPLIIVLSQSLSLIVNLFKYVLLHLVVTLNYLIEQSVWKVGLFWFSMVSALSVISQFYTTTSISPVFHYSTSDNNMIPSHTSHQLMKTPKMSMSLKKSTITVCRRTKLWFYIVSSYIRFSK